MYFAIAIVIVLIAETILALTTKHPKTTPPLFKDFDFPVPDEGTPQAVVFGDCWCGDWMVLWVGNYQTQTIRQKSKGK